MDQFLIFIEFLKHLSFSMWNFLLNSTNGFSWCYQNSISLYTELYVREILFFNRNIAISIPSHSEEFPEEGFRAMKESDVDRLCSLNEALKSLMKFKITLPSTVRIVANSIYNMNVASLKQREGKICNRENFLTLKLLVK